MLLLGFIARELVTVGMRRTGKVAISPTIHTSPHPSSLHQENCSHGNRHRKMTFPPFSY